MSISVRLPVSARSSVNSQLVARLLGFLALGLISVTPRVAAGDVVYPPGSPPLGARYDVSGQNILFRVYSSRASRIEVCIYDRPTGADEKAKFALTREPKSDIWAIKVTVADLAAKGIKDPVYYGFRA